MKQIFSARQLLFALFVLLLVIGCEKQIETEKPSDTQSVNTVQNNVTGDDGALVFRIDASQHANADLLKSLRAATSRFNSTTQAIDAGYEPDDHCVAVPGLGGMGYHWVNGSLIDPVFDLQKPEVVLYETGPGGNLRLVAVEYIVINTGQARPMFGDYPFDIGGTPVQVPHWSLHVWVHKENPNGVFVKFNPTVSCP